MPDISVRARRRNDGVVDPTTSFGNAALAEIAGAIFTGTYAMLY